ncbi:hypothetical protein [Paracoccus sp. KR1-242]|uniref:hypothetical protein n=1 Tax=Paracoccus sp. KR1-242 TaxID=3410028 RepID=UPI003C094BD9
MTSLYVESENELSIVYPDAPAGVNGSVPAAIWGKLESYVNSRWTTSEVVFEVNPPCPVNWRPPYVPYVIEAVDDEPAEVNQYGEVRVTGRALVRCTIGGKEVTPEVEEAYRRLAAYYASEDLRGYSRYSVNIDGSLQESWARRRDATALANSGAADLLTKHRKAGIAHV